VTTSSLRLSITGSGPLSRRRLLGSSLAVVSLTGLPRLLAGCAANAACQNDWLGRASDGCLPSNYQPGEVVFAGRAEPGDDPFSLRDRLATDAGFSAEQLALLSGLLYYTLETSDGSEVVPDEAEDASQERVFAGGETVRFRLARVALVAEPVDEADQYELVADQYAGDLAALPAEMAILALRRDGTVRLPAEQEFIITGYGTPDELWQFVLQPGERVVFLDVRTLHSG
jgi:hypothetical protein